MDFIKSSMKEPLLARDFEFELARRWREDGDEDALHEMVRSYMRLVVSTATRFRNYGLPMGDLVQEGNVGLMQAAARFEPEREIRFSTYATWWIRSAMQDYVLRNWSIVRTGTTPIAPICAKTCSIFISLLLPCFPPCPLTKRGLLVTGSTGSRPASGFASTGSVPV